jgi:molybdenum cofactor biosynthesis protein B
MGHHVHRREAPRQVPTAILTVSDTRTPDTDSSGTLIRRLLDRAGHPVVEQAILPDEPGRIRRLLRTWSRDPRIRAVVLTGGTGISPRDRTIESLEGLLEKKLEGFGEIFRMLSYRQVGSAAILSRAVAGTYRGRIILSLPGSERAVALAMRKIILPELGHLAYEASKLPQRFRGRARRGG